jgi:hypothetical protein
MRSILFFVMLYSQISFAEYISCGDQPRNEVNPIHIVYNKSDATIYRKWGEGKLKPYIDKSTYCGLKIVFGQPTVISTQNYGPAFRTEYNGMLPPGSSIGNSPFAMHAIFLYDSRNNTGSLSCDNYEDGTTYSYNLGECSIVPDLEE